MWSEKVGHNISTESNCIKKDLSFHESSHSKV